MKKIILLTLVISLLFVACNSSTNNSNTEDNNVEEDNSTKEDSDYKIVELNSDLSELSANNKEMIKIFIEASKYVDSMFFYEAYGSYDIFETTEDEKLKKLIQINFGIWDRFNNNKPLMDNADNKPLGANFYPANITKEEFDNFNDSLKLSPYTFVKRNEEGALYTVTYHEQFQKYVNKISELLIKATEYCKNEDFNNYLKLRANALQTDDYRASDLAWLELKNNKIDFVLGPIITYEDKLYNQKAEHQSYILLKNDEWSKKMEKYDKWLPFLQKALPVEEDFRKDEPGTHSKLIIYDAIYYGGSGKVGGVMFSLMQPLDAKIQIEKGIRNLQFKNVIEYKFTEIAKPISELIFVNNQKDFIKKDAFFTNAILYEIANSLGIRNTINNKGTVREALKENFTISDILKNYVLSLFLAEKLYEIEEITNELEENYITFVANSLRLMRFGTSNDYAKASLICFNYYQKNGAIIFTENEQIKVDYKKMKELTTEFTKIILTYQGNGDYQKATDFINEYGTVSKQLQKIIDKTNSHNIPKDIVFKQGADVLGI